METINRQEVAVFIGDSVPSGQIFLHFYFLIHLCQRVKPNPCSPMAPQGPRPGCLLSLNSIEGSRLSPPSTTPPLYISSWVIKSTSSTSGEQGTYFPGPLGIQMMVIKRLLPPSICVKWFRLLFQPQPTTRRPLTNPIDLSLTRCSGGDKQHLDSSDESEMDAPVSMLHHQTKGSSNSTTSVTSGGDTQNLPSVPSSNPHQMFSAFQPSHQISSIMGHYQQQQQESHSGLSGYHQMYTSSNLNPGESKSARDDWGRQDGCAIRAL